MQVERADTLTLNFSALDDSVAEVLQSKTGYAFQKVLDKMNRLRYYIRADSHSGLTKSLQKLYRLLMMRGSVPWKLNNAIRNHAHMISSQMLDFVSAMRMQNINKTRFVRNTIWNSITWIILRAIQVLQYIYWRVWSWLRTNAGGVLNTCKSNGAKW